MPDRKQPTLGLKILAVLMAVALWGFVGISQRHLGPDQGEKRLSLAIELKHPPPTLRVRPDPPVAQVVVEGPAKAVEKLAENDLSAFVDLRFKHVSEGRAPVHVSVPEGMRYTVTPESVALVPSRSESNRRTR